MTLRTALACACAALLLPGGALAGGIASSVDAAALPEKERTTLGLYLTARDAAAALEVDPGLVLIDVRSQPEFAFVGHPDPTDRNIPFEFIDPAFAAGPEAKSYAMVPNAGFVAEVAALLAEQGLGREAPILVICRSGSRSADAVDALAAAGFTNVWNVIEGFEGDRDPETGHRTEEGWRHEGLPWSYDFRPGQAWIPAAP